MERRFSEYCFINSGGSADQVLGNYLRIAVRLQFHGIFYCKKCAEFWGPPYPGTLEFHLSHVLFIPDCLGIRCLFYLWKASRMVSRISGLCASVFLGSFLLLFAGKEFERACHHYFSGCFLSDCPLFAGSRFFSTAHTLFIVQF